MRQLTYQAHEICEQVSLSENARLDHIMAFYNMPLEKVGKYRFHEIDNMCIGFNEYFSITSKADV